MSFSQKVKEDALVACQRYCCICHCFSGISMEVHHIIQEADGGEDTFENAIPVCSNCHAIIGSYNPRHPRGNKYTPGELRRIRDDWYEKIRNTPAFRASEETRELDVVVYDQLKQYLLPKRMEKIRDVDFGGGIFKVDFFDPLDQFSERSRNPLMSYFDAELEKKKMQLAEAINKFTNDSLPYLSSDDGKYIRIPADWAIDFPERFEEGVRILNEDSFAIWDAYVAYIEMCRHRLLITGQ